MLFRLRLIMIGVGGVLAFIGFQEYRVSSGTTAEPLAVELAALERGESPDNTHLKIGEHIAMYSEAVYEYETEESFVGEPGLGVKVNYCYYPIISGEHRFFEALAQLALEHGGLENIPDSVPDPEIESFAVLVKSKRFKTVGSIPDDWADEASIQGLVINRVKSLKGEEAELIKQDFPKLDLDKVLILEHDRKPASLAKSLGMTFGGALLVLIGIGLFFVGGGQSAERS